MNNMTVSYRTNKIEAVLITNDSEGFEDEIVFIHPLTGSTCEQFEQVFQGWSSQDVEENKELDRMKELYRENNKDIYERLLYELDVQLEHYELEA